MGVSLTQTIGPSQEGGREWWDGKGLVVSKGLERKAALRR